MIHEHIATMGDAAEAFEVWLLRAYGVRTVRIANGQVFKRIYTIREMIRDVLSP